MDNSKYFGVGYYRPGNEVWVKVIFSEACVEALCQQLERACMAGGACVAGGHVW